MKRYSGDPHWITAKFGYCMEAGCGKALAGQQAFFYPNGKKIYCQEHGRPMYQRFVAEAQDEESYQRGYGI